MIYMTKESIFEMLEGFSKHADGHLIKTIHFTFPVTYDGESGVLFVSSTGGEVETVCLLSKLSEAKNHISVKVDMDEMDLTEL